jgi:CRP/FNR family transcriptional regulator, anaerobic regulatory protein
MDVQHAFTQIGASRCASIGCSICAGLSPSAKQELARLARTRSFCAGETILAEADEIGFVGHVIEGVLRMQKTLPDGRQQIVGLLLPGDMFGRVFADVSPVAIEAATQVTLCCYNRVRFEALFARFPELEHRILLAISHELDAAQDWLLLLATQSVTERVATFLLILRRRRASLVASSAAHEGSFVEVPITRKDMAAYLGTTAESISRTIHTLARIRIISIIDPQRFEILDEARLVEQSGQGPEAFGLYHGGLQRTG